MRLSNVLLLHLVELSGFDRQRPSWQAIVLLPGAARSESNCAGCAYMVGSSHPSASFHDTPRNASPIKHIGWAYIERVPDAGIATETSGPHFIPVCSHCCWRNLHPPDIFFRTTLYGLIRLPVFFSLVLATGVLLGRPFSQGFPVAINKVDMALKPKIGFRRLRRLTHDTLQRLLVYLEKVYIPRDAAILNRVLELRPWILGLDRAVRPSTKMCTKLVFRCSFKQTLVLYKGQLEAVDNIGRVRLRNAVVYTVGDNVFAPRPSLVVSISGTVDHPTPLVKFSVKEEVFDRGFRSGRRPGSRLV